MLDQTTSSSPRLVRGACPADCPDTCSWVVTFEVSERVRPGDVASVRGYWPGRVAGAANANATVSERDSDMGGGAEYHDNRVEVESLA